MVVDFDGQSVALFEKKAILTGYAFYGQEIASGVV